jgi:hypothetical protein
VGLLAGGLMVVWCSASPEHRATRRTCNFQTPSQEDEARGAARLLHNCHHRVAERCEEALGVFVAAFDATARQPRGATCNASVVQSNGRRQQQARVLKPMASRNQARV